MSKERLKIEKSNLVHGLIGKRPNQKAAKLGQLGTGPGSRDPLLNVGAPSIFKERLKTQTSTLVCGLTKRPLQIVRKLGQLGTEPGSHDLILNFWIRCVTLQCIKTETSNFVCRLILLSICHLRIYLVLSLCNKTANIKYKKTGVL